MAMAGETVKGATSSDPDGTLLVPRSAGATYSLKVELMGFVGGSRELVAGPPPCDQKIELELKLAGQDGYDGYDRYGGYGGYDRTTVRRARGAGPRFETLAVETNANGGRGGGRRGAGARRRRGRGAAAAAARILHRGADRGGRHQWRHGVDRSRHDERPDGGDWPRRSRSVDRRVPAAGGAGRGRLAAGEFGGRSWRARRPGRRRWARRPARTVRPRRSRRRTRAVPADRAGSAAAAFSRTRTSSPPTTRSAARRSTARPISCGPTRRRRQRPYSRHNFGGSVVGPGQNPEGLQRHAAHELPVHLQRQSVAQPVRSVRDGADRRRSGPATSRARCSRWSTRRRACHSPAIVIPANRIAPGARVLLDYLPQANLPGTTRNYHYATTTDSSSNNVSLRVTHNFSAPPAGARGGGAGRGGAAGGRGGGGFGGPGRSGRSRRPRQSGHDRQHDRATAVPRERRRAGQRVPDARRRSRPARRFRCRSRSTSRIGATSTRSTST